MPEELTNQSSGSTAKWTPASRPDGEEIDVRHIFDLLFASKWILFAIVLLFLVGGGAYLIVTPPIYEADGLVQVEDNSSKTSSALSDISSLLLGNPVATEAELQIIRSRMVLDQVIDEMNLLVDAQPRYFPVIGAPFARRNKGATTEQAAPYLVRHFAWGGENITVPTLDVPTGLINQALVLRATGQGYDLEDADGVHILSGVVGQTATADSSYGGPISIFVRELKARPGTEFMVAHYARQTVQNRLVSALKVAEQGRQSGVIKITFSDSSPRFATTVLNNVEGAYLRQNVERRSAQAQQSLEFLQKQLPELKANADAAQAKLNAYQSSKGSIDVTQETSIVLQQSVTLESQRLELVQQREEALQRFTPKHPVIQGIDQQLDVLSKELEKVKSATEKLPTTQQEILGLMRDLDVDNQIYTEMLDSIQSLQVVKAGTIGNVRIVDKALNPMRPTSPKRALTMFLSLLLGVATGVGFVFAQRALLKGVDDPADVERVLSLVTYASIPYTAAQKKLTREMGRGQPGNYLLAQIDGKNLSIEALRSLRSSLHFALIQSPNNIVMLTGPSPGLGKSFVACNLGAVLAASGKKVVVIDADLRKGHLHAYLSVQAQPGLSDFIAGSATVADIVQKNPLEGLYAVSRGASPPNPAELLLHPRFSELLQALSAEFDYVLIDTPPVLAVTDACIVGRLAGSSLMVLKSAQHPMREIEETHRRLISAGVDVKGVIFNQVGAKAGSYGYGGYGYQYYDYNS